MANKAVSKFVIQVALVIGLVLAANAIKPFSPSNVVLHTMASARSFSFVLPSGAVKRIEHANYLAQTFSKGLFERGTSNSVWTREPVLRSGLLASNYSLELFADAEIKDVKPGESTRKQSPSKRSTRRVRQENRDRYDEVSTDTNSGEIARKMAELPISPTFDSIATTSPARLPVFRPLPVKAHLLPTSRGFSLAALPAKLNSCKTIEVKEIKLIALIQQSQQAKLKIDMVATQPAKISLQCREEDKVITEEAEAVVETTTGAGPEEEFFFEQPTVTGPFAATPFPECKRLP